MELRHFKNYNELKQVHQNDINQFPLGFAFSDVQVEEMMQKWGLTTKKSDLKKVVSLGSGCYILRDDIAAYNALTTQHHEELLLFENETFENLVEMIFSEMNNHEYGYTCDPEDTLLALGKNHKDIEGDSKFARAWKMASAQCFARG